MNTKRKTKKSRDIDATTKNSYKWLKKTTVLMRKKDINTWHGVALIAFISGAIATGFWLVSTDRKMDSNAAGNKNVAVQKGKIVKGELLVKFKDDVSDSDQNTVLKGNGAKVAEEIKKIKVKRISVPEKAQDNVREALLKSGKFEFVENNGLAEGSLVPNDPNYARQWHLSKIAAPAAWDISTGLASVPVAIIDSGADPAHPDLSSSLISGYSFLTNTTDTRDTYGHGTATAGTAAAIGNNAIGVSGLAMKSSIMPLVVLDSSNYASYANIARAIIYASDQGVRVMNISIGGTSSSLTMQSAIDYAWNKNAIIFAAAGNNNSNVPIYPAALNKVIAVSATDSADNRSSFSSYGAWIDISAPGTNIYTTLNGGSYGGYNGTSFASPLAAGLAALILSVNSGLTNVQVENIIKTTAYDLGSAGFDEYFGYGRINAQKALEYVKNGQVIVPPADTSAPVVSFSYPAANATISGTIAISISAQDNVNVSKIEFYKNNELVGSSNSGNYSYSWNTKNDSNGTYSLLAKSYDSSNNVGTKTISVTVNNVSDVIAPTISITQPLNGTSILPKVLSISANAQDNVGIATINIYLDGKAVKTCDNVTTCTINKINTTKMTSGSHIISASAVDTSGNKAEASQVNITK